MTDMKDIVAKIKSGADFKIVDYPNDCHYFYKECALWTSGSPATISIQELLFDLLEGKIELEFEEEKIEITRAKLELAWNFMFRMDSEDNNLALHKAALPLLASKLGFK